MLGTSTMTTAPRLTTPWPVVRKELIYLLLVTFKQKELRFPQVPANNSFVGKGGQGVPNLYGSARLK